MLRVFLNIKIALVKFLEVAVILITGVLVLDVIWQVFTRFVIQNPSSWTEELATILLIWVSLLGASVAFIRKGHLGVDYFVNKLQGKSRILMDLVVHLLVAFFAGIMIGGGITLVNRTLVTQQILPAIGLKMGYVYLAVPISGFFILIFSVEMGLRTLDLLLKAGDPEHKES